MLYDVYYKKEQLGVCFRNLCIVLVIWYPMSRRVLGLIVSAVANVLGTTEDSIHTSARSWRFYYLQLTTMAVWYTSTYFMVCRKCTLVAPYTKKSIAKIDTKSALFDDTGKPKV
jgi:hypothetical protein